MSERNVRPTERDEAKAAMAERSAALLGAGSPSELPADASLTPDAQAMRAAERTPLEQLADYAAGRLELDAGQLRALIAMLPYIHKQQMAQREAADPAAQQAAMLAAMRQLCDEERLLLASATQRAIDSAKTPTA